MTFAWTDTAIADLRRLWLKGLSASAVAAAITAKHGGTLSRNAILGKVHRLGISRPDQQAKALKASNARKASRAGRVARAINAGKPVPEPKPAAAPKPKPEPRGVAPKQVEAPVASAGRPTLFDAGRDCCRFPLWPKGPAPQPAEAFVCGEPVATVRGAGRPYCATHAALCSTREQPPEKAEKPKRKSNNDRVFRRMEAA